MEIWTGFIVGLLGSFHCIGMCGPIAISLPISNGSRLKIIFSRVLYNVGRIITYSLLGALFGLFGNRLILFGLQQYLSIALGVIILIYFFTPRNIKTKISSLTLIQQAYSILNSQFLALLDSSRSRSILFSNRSNISLFVIGLLNGLLPCGFVYVGIAGSISTGSWLIGMLYMTLFGLGTFPIMFAASLFGKIINVKVRQKINKLIPAFTLILALLFILRGMNLGIPYLSPKLSSSSVSNSNTECH